MDTLITASPEFFKGKSPKEIQAFFQRAADFLIDRVGRKHIPTRLFKQAVSLSKQTRAIEATLDGINPINAGHTGGGKAAAAVHKGKVIEYKQNFTPPLCGIVP